MVVALSILCVFFYPQGNSGGLPLETHVGQEKATLGLQHGSGFVAVHGAEPHALTTGYRGRRPLPNTKYYRKKEVVGDVERAPHQ